MHLALDMLARIIVAATAGALLGAAAPEPPPVAYVGKYPFAKVNGVSFVANSRIRRGVLAAVGLTSLRDQVLSAGISSPISTDWGLVISPACEPHNCTDHNWTIAVRPNGRAAVCYHNANLTDDTSRWFVAGLMVAREAGTCPDGPPPQRVIDELRATR